MRRPSYLALLLSPALVGVVAACGYGICVAAGWRVDARTIGWAIAVAVVAAELALVPPLLARGASQLTMSQAALAAMVLHLLVAAGGGLVVSSALKPGPAFMYWLCAFFWATLVGVCLIVTRAVRSAPVHRGA